MFTAEKEFLEFLNYTYQQGLNGLKYPFRTYPKQTKVDKVEYGFLFLLDVAKTMNQNNDNLYDNEIYEITSQTILKVSDESKRCIRYNVSDIIQYTEEKLNAIMYESLPDSEIKLLEEINLYEEEITEILTQLKKMIYLYDDIKLTELIKKTNDETKDLVDSSRKYKKYLNDTIENIKHYEDRLNNILPNAISIIGIFAGILIVLFSGFSILDLLSKFNPEKPFISGFFIVLIGMIMLNVVFLFLFLISRLSEKSINVRCVKYVSKHWREEEAEKLKSMNDETLDKFLKLVNKEIDDKNNKFIVCSNCVYSKVEQSIAENHFKGLYKIKGIDSDDTIGTEINLSQLKSKQCGQFDKAFFKYPYIVFSNIILIFLQIFFLLWWFIKDFIFINFNYNVQHPLLLTLTLLLGLIILISSIIIFFISLGKQGIWIHFKKLAFIIILITITSTLVISSFCITLTKPTNEELGSEQIRQYINILRKEYIKY